jgi:tetratricopeptide (TPR) repeat protein
VTSVERQPPLAVSLSVNDGIAAVVNNDQPLVIHVSLTNYEAQDAAMYNDSLKSRMEGLRKEAKEKDLDREELKKRLKALSDELKPVRAVRFGGQKTWTGFVELEVGGASGWRPCNWPTHLLSWSPDSEVAEVDADRMAYVELGVDPEEFAQVEKGPHALRVSVELLRGSATFSNQVTVEATGVETPAEVKSGEPFLTALASYWIKRGMKNRAKAFLTDEILRHPGYANLLVLAGDLLRSEGDLKGALALYQRALEAYRKKQHNATEQPEALIDRIQDIQLALLRGR